MAENSPSSTPNDQPAVGETPAAPERRKVYESTLLPERKRMRAPAWLVVPAILIVAGVLWYISQAATREIRTIPTQGKIVYSSDTGSSGSPHLWMVAADGSGAPVQLNAGEAIGLSPSFAPNGSQIAYLSKAAKDRNQVFVMDADGKRARQVTRTSGSKSSPAFTPGDGAVIGFLDTGAFSTAVTNTGEISRVLPAGGPTQETSQSGEKDQHQQASDTPTVVSFAWAPSTDSAHQGVAAVLELNGLQMLTVVPDINDGASPKPFDPKSMAMGQMLSVAWSPNGNIIAAAMFNIPVAKGHTFSALALFDSTGTRLPTAPPLLVEQDKTTGPQNPVFSPDGNMIVFERWDQPDLTSQKHLGLWIVPKDASAPAKQIYNGDARDAQFLPDGQTVIFLSQRPDGGRDLCRVGVDGTGFKKLTDGTGDVSGFSISRQGVMKQ
jgi:Tol biopolymer transport system component